VLLTPRPYPRYHGNVIWPASEADSLILQVMWGCSYGKCGFCGAYMGKSFRLRPVDAIKEDIQFLEEGLKENVTRVFLCDGDALALPLPRMIDILDTLAAELPRLTKVSAYADAHSLQPIPLEELQEMREHGLEMIYVGLESGDDETLLQSGKGLSSAQLIRAFLKAKEAGLALAVTAILGLGGKERTVQHAAGTGRALSAIDPQHIGILSLVVEPGTHLEERIRRQQFVMPDAQGMLRELRGIIAETNVTQALFRTDHAAAYLSLSGTLPADKQTLLDRLDEAMAEPEQAASTRSEDARVP
jgi:radical SAM superfamily enzyme YgiQ (UPF0313 family)